MIRLLPHRLLLRIIRFNIIWMLPLFDALVFLNLGFLSRFLPITDIRCFPDGLSPKLRREWAVMDTFDAFSPQFDNPQRVCDVATFFRNSGCRIDFAGYVSFNGGSSPVVRAARYAEYHVRFLWSSITFLTTFIVDLLREING